VRQQPGAERAVTAGQRRERLLQQPDAGRPGLEAANIRNPPSAIT
jgi:hypothetical protein